MDDQAKTFRIKRSDGQWLSFDFDASSGKMNPMWGPISMCYSFTEGKAWDIVDIFAQREPELDMTVVDDATFKAEYAKFEAEIKARSEARTRR